MSSKKLLNSTYINNYLFLYNKSSKNAKRIRRKLLKKNVYKLFTVNTYNNFEDDSVTLLGKYIESMFQKNEHIGFISDNNVLLANIQLLPPLPLEWDILCLDSLVDNYVFNDEQNNIYWCRSQISNTNNLIINRNKIHKVYSILKTVKTWSGFIDALNDNMSIYTITQNTLSEPVNHFVEAPNITKNMTKSEQEQSLKNTEYKCAAVLQKFKFFVTKELSEDLSEQKLPNISLLTILSDTNKFFNVLYTFLKLDYPREKLELVIVDDQDMEKKIKGLLPDDKRIKIVNLTRKKKDEDSGVSLVPLGYKLNMGVKYSTHDVIFHFFDTSFLISTNFKSIVNTFMASQKNALMSCDTGFYDISEKKSYNLKVPNLTTCMYTKNFWKTNSFHDYQNSPIVLVYKFIKNRIPAITFVPFVKLSFNVELNSNCSNKQNCLVTKLPFTLMSLIEDNYKESFDIAFQN
jgi:hypothetical protein